MSIAVKRTQRERLSVAARRSILGGVITLFIDSYDIYLPALVLQAARKQGPADRRRVPTPVN